MGYGQYCGCARALDVVGDRWTLLIVRELLVRPARFSELRDGLPGIASNLLSARLKALQADGVVERRLADPGVVYALTAWGQLLREPLQALAAWAAPLMAPGRQDAAFRPHWLVLPLEVLLAGHTANTSVQVGLHVDGVTLGLHADPGGVRLRLEDSNRPSGAAFDVELTTDGPTVLGLFTGARSLDEVLAAGAHLTGDRSRLEDLLTVPTHDTAVTA
jgi:DNA-binding HxlR family transcriptional regulator